jgi:hypothetical protein
MTQWFVHPIPFGQTFSLRARTLAGATIFVQIGAENFSEMCVRVRA